MQYLTMDVKRNKFRFVCPIFNAETSMASCVHLRDLTFYGGAPLGKRRGCQACVKSNKCPAQQIIYQLTYTQDKSDDYGSETPVLGKLREPILRRIRRVIVQDQHLAFYEVPEAERALIESSGRRIDKLLETAPKGSGNVAPKSRRTSSATKRRASAAISASAPKPAPKTAPSASEAIKHAAMTGDMSAAINMGESNASA